MSGGALTAGTVNVSGGYRRRADVNGVSNLVGNLGVAGTVTGGQGVFDAGFRVFSPVNPPPAAARGEEIEALPALVGGLREEYSG